ncbi:unnamed protein product, partial [Durusdinium trenchii]
MSSPCSLQQGWHWRRKECLCCARPASHTSEILLQRSIDRRDGVARRARATAAATHMFFVSVAAMVPVMFSFLMTPLLQRLEAKEDDDAMVDVN